MTAKQRPHILLSLYVTLYEKAYGFKPPVNRNRDKWGFSDMIEDLGMDRAREVVEWYFDTGATHTFSNLFRTYDKISMEIDEYNRDRKHLADVREATRQRVEEFRRAKIEQHRGKGNIGGSDPR